MREKKGNADRRLVAGREPLVGEEADGSEIEAFGLKLPLELPDAEFEVGPFDLHVEIADPEVKEIVVGERLPRDLGLTADQRLAPRPESSYAGGPRMLTRGF